VELTQVLRDVWAETKIPLVVYSTEEALNATPLPLPAALKVLSHTD